MSKYMANKALVIDDDKTTLELFEFQLRHEGYDVASAETGLRGLELATTNEFDVVLTDLNLPDINGIEMVKRSKALSPETEIIVVTGDASTERAVEAIREGARDYIVKPVDFEKLLIVIRNAVDAKHQAEINKQQAAEIAELRGRLSSRTSYEGLIGGSRSMQDIYEMIESVAESDANILILGESGTGKELIANAIHYKSHRSNRPFVKINCAALPKELIESQLFGHIKGSFTGAHTDKEGLVGQAKGGSLLLDEIGEMPAELQPKLLRLLQEKVYYRVGGDKPLDADFRLISSTNRDPFDAIKDGNLREDLYYRINTIEIKIPPLRDRKEDIPMLAEHFLETYTAKYKIPNKGFSSSAYEQMLENKWRGNVRELQSVIERAVLLGKGGRIDRLTTTDGMADSFVGQAGAVAIAGSTSQAEKDGLQPQFDTSAVNFIDEVGKLIVEKLPEPNDVHENSDILESIEAAVARAAILRMNGNKQAAAKLLGIYRPRLYGMIKRHGLDATK